MLVDEDGSTKSLHNRLKGIKVQLKLWYSRTKEVKYSRKKNIMSSLRNTEEKIDAGCANDEDKVLRVNGLQELDGLEKLESMDLVQKARVKWEVKGDENLNFFHDIINSRRKSRMIQDSMVSLEEIRAAIWDCGSQKVLGPDDFLFVFVKKFWDLLKHDIQTFVVNFFISSTFPQGSNLTIITLIPKVSNPLYIKDYRRISLIGIHYKIFSKILANKLSKVIDLIINHEHCVFILGRQILDGPLILSVAIDWYKKRKKKMILFKVDFEKAFDSVSSRFLDHVLEKLGFSVKWHDWIKAGLVSAETSILLNGSPTPYFSLKRGLRQGDPLSYFLFIIVMEGLHVALMDGLVANMFRGVKVGSSDIPLSHLFYADDVIIIFDKNQNDMGNIIRILNVFYIAFGCVAGSFPFCYHTLPIDSNMGRIVNWKELIDRFKARLLGWKTNLLSIGGQLTFIKSVLERGDGVASIKRRHRDLSGDGVWILATALQRNRLKVDLEPSTWRRRQEIK
ncbi:putative RNA-directed DNA polymerase, eukaryota, reverse transcriptase zinc-binding domain protein [Tanacetum coccineum]